MLTQSPGRQAELAFDRFHNEVYDWLKWYRRSHCSLYAKAVDQCHDPSRGAFWMRDAEHPGFNTAHDQEAHTLLPGEHLPGDLGTQNWPPARCLPGVHP